MLHCRYSETIKNIGLRASVRMLCGCGLIFFYAADVADNTNRKKIVW